MPELVFGEMELLPTGLPVRLKTVGEAAAGAPEKLTEAAKPMPAIEVASPSRVSRGIGSLEGGRVLRKPCAAGEAELVSTELARNVTTLLNSAILPCLGRVVAGRSLLDCIQMPG